MAQTVTITGVNDWYVEPATGRYSAAYTITASVSSTGSDPIYDKNNPNVNAVTSTLINTDNDTYNVVTVTTTADVSDGDTSSIAALCNNPGADGAISLREALLAADNTPTPSGQGNNLIYFNIPYALGQDTVYADPQSGDPGHTVTLRTYTINILGSAGNLPNVGAAVSGVNYKVSIDATTQPGYDPNNPRPIVEVSGEYHNSATINSTTEPGRALFGFNLRNSGETLRGLVINNFAKGAINTANSNCTIAGCYIGTDLTGTLAKPNGWYGNSSKPQNATSAVYIGGSGSTVGGTTPADRNIISGNQGVGLSINANSCIVEGNYIGVDATGNTVLGNTIYNYGGPVAGTGVGISIAAGKTGTTIGGTSPGAANIIGGNALYGIDCTGNNSTTDTTITTIAGNYIGVSPTGADVGNTGCGICIESASKYNLIGGTAAAAGNNIAYNGLHAYSWTYNSTTGTYVETVTYVNNGNYGVQVLSTATPGTMILGNNIFSNSGGGISVAAGASPPNAPAITSATTDASSLIRICGTLSATANRTYRIGFLANSQTDAGGHWEGQEFLGYTTVTTDGSGNATFTTDLSANIALGKTINAVATDLTTQVTGVCGQTVAADQSPGITVTPTSGLTTKEDGATAQFSVVLNSAPLYDVTIPIASDNTAEGVVSTSWLTFTQANWNIAQVVTVTGVPDSVTDGNQLYHIITGAAATSDPLYSGLNPSDVSVTNLDIDVPGIIVTPATNPLITSENHLAATFTVRLNTRPDSPVTIGLSSSNTAEGTIDKSSVTFDASNWNVAQTVTVTGQDDGAISSTNVAYSIITAPATSADTHYSGIDAADASVTNVANDTAGISVIPITSLTTTEAGGQANFVVLLNKQPGSDVTTSLSSSDTTEGTIDKSSLSFTTSNPAAADYWNKPQTVTVTGVPDNIVDGNIAYAINFSHAVSGDLAYNGLQPSSVSLTNADIDAFNKIYVNTTSDTADGTTTSIAALYANPGSDGVISLREAILAANNTVNAVGGPDHIYFDITGLGVHTITPASALPNISDAVVIDGYTQPGSLANTLSAGDNAVILIEISGANAGSGANGLTLAANSNGSTIRGLAIDRFNGSGIKVISSNDTITGNFLGTNAGGGDSGLGNGYGVYVTGANNIIGGASAAERNLISENTTGIDVYGATATGNTIQGNYIGTNTAGTAALANATGVLADQSTNLTIGGTASGDGNLIAYNTGIGVNVSATSIGVEILGNSIYSNGNLSIDLGGNGVTANDTGDTDTGANNLQNFPVLTYATILNGTLTVHGSLNSTAGTTYRIEVFANDAADGTGYGEGQVYLGSFNVTTDGTGNANFDSFSNVLNVNVAPGKMISATATNLTTKDTSEFARCDGAVAPAIIVTPISGLITYKDNHQQATFTVVLASAPVANVAITITSLNTYEGILVNGANLASSITLVFTPTSYGPQTVTVAGVNNGIIEGNIAYTIATAAAVSADLNYNGVNAADVAATNNNTNTYNTICVDTNSDAIDGDTSSIANLFYNRGADGKISLREAIAAADNTLNGPGPSGTGANDCIYFNITPDAGNPTGSHTIVLTSTLPNITEGVTIDGTTDPAFHGTPIIELDGENAGSATSGINIRSPWNTIRGLVINRFGRNGIYMLSSHNIVTGCYIGTDVTGMHSTYTVTDASGTTTKSYANGWDTVHPGSGIYFGGNDQTIGGTNPGDRNVLSGNIVDGIYIGGSTNNIIEGNYIGVNASGNVALPNGQAGIGIGSGITGITIGGTTDSARNVISGNGSYGIDIAGFGNIVEGNYVGLNASGVAAIGNASHGIYLESTAYNNTIGGTAVGAGNTIACNAGDGVNVADGTTAVGNAILSNSIYTNSGLGIRLGAGANDSQSFPTLAGVAATVSQMNIQGALTSTAGHTFRIEFFASDSADATGYGEGQQYLGYVQVTTDDAGNANFLATLSPGVAAGKYISATATDLTTNDTSQFARNIIAQAPRLVLIAADDLQTTEDGGTAHFSVALNGPPAPDVTIAVSSSDVTEGTVSTSSLTFTPSNWNVPQCVTVAGVMDYLCDGNMSYAVNFDHIASGDAIFNGRNGAAQALTNLDHVNCPPLLTVPAKQTTNTTLLFSRATQNAIQIADVDAGPDPLRVQLTATNGQLTLGSTAGLTFTSGAGSGSAAMEFTGTTADINAALEGMRFAPSASDANLLVAVNDLGNSGSGGPKSIAANIPVQVVTPQRRTVNAPVLPPLQAPVSPSQPSTTPLPLANSPCANANTISSFEQHSHLDRLEATEANRALSRGNTNVPVNVRPTQIAAADVNGDYLSAHDRFQTYAMQPIVTRLAGAGLTLQSVMDTQLLWKQIKDLAAQGEMLPWLSKINVGTVIGISAGLSAGYVMMAFRWGALITSGLAATFPVWQWIDPLPILESSKSKLGGLRALEETDPNADSQSPDSLESLMS